HTRTRRAGIDDARGRAVTHCPPAGQPTCPRAVTHCPPAGHAWLGASSAAYGGAMRVLVTGGAGYIGSHTVVQLAAAGHEVVVVDSFANAKPTVVPRLEALVGGPLEVHAFDLTD